MKHKHNRPHKVLTEHLTTKRAIAEFTIAVGVVLTASIISLSSAFAWGPERQTYTMEVPATAPTMNSITNNPMIGDERNFVRVREAGAGDFIDTAEVEPGKTYEVYIFYHNNAADNFNFDTNRSGIAVNVRMRSSFPKELAEGERGTITGALSSGDQQSNGLWTNSNTNPPLVWDEAFITATTDLNLHYIAGSAKIYNNGRTNGQVLSENLFSDIGTFLGVNTLNGMLPGCAQYSGHVIYKIKAEKTEYSVEKTVMVVEGETTSTEPSETVAANPGDTVEYSVQFMNTGTTSLYNVTLHDELPDQLVPVAGSVKLTNYNNPNGVAVSDDFFGAGINIGSYGPDYGATITYRAMVHPSKSFECGQTTLLNKAILHTGAGTIDDSATVNVYKDCGGTPPPGETEPMCEVPGKEQLLATDPNCIDDGPGEPIVELPVTGPVEVVGAIVGVAMVVVAAVYYVRSRKLLQNS